MKREISNNRDIKYPKKNILFLGYGRNETSLIDHLIKYNCEVNQTNNPIKEIRDFDLAISFGYRHIISNKLLENCGTPIINLHISLLPWNRGYHPNFWSFFDNTPSGVTIHFINKGIDTGDIIYQREIIFNDDEDTFAKTHARLIYEMEKLFFENIDNSLMQNYKRIPQTEKGTYHNSFELPKGFAGWDSNIKNEIARLKKSI